MSTELVECRTCGKLFDPNAKKQLKGGYIDECPKCGWNDRQAMYLGRAGGPHKSANIEIYRDNLAFYRAVLRREAGAGMNPNLGIASTVSPVGLRSLKEEEE